MTLGTPARDQPPFSWISYIRGSVLHIHPKKFILNTLHLLAMNCPVYKLRIVFYRMRGTKIGKNVAFAPHVFLDELHPELITIGEGADIGPYVMVVTHDSILFHLDPPDQTVRMKEVYIGRNCYIGAGTIILPGVTVGDNSIIGAGSVVTKSVPAGSVAMGLPARVVCPRDEWNRKYLVNR